MLELLAAAAALNAEIYSVRADGSEPPVNLSQNAATDVYPAESPEGRRIAFVSNRDGYDALYVMNNDGSEPRRLTSRITQGDYARCGLGQPAWSPTGATIAVNVFCVAPNGDPRQLRRSIYTVPNGGGDPLELVRGGFDASFSADGRYVAYTSQPSSYAPLGVGVVALRGGAPVTLAERGYVPAWSAKGHRLAFAWEGHGLAVLDAAKPRRRWVLRNKLIGGPGWSPRGRIAFYLDGSRPGIYVVRPGSRSFRRLVDLGEGATVHWAPNGRWLALAGANATYVVTNSGRFLSIVSGGGAVAWSPDSEWLASVDEGVGAIVVSKPPVSGLYNGYAESIYGVTWSRDSRRVIFSSAPRQTSREGAARRVRASSRWEEVKRSPAKGREGVAVWPRSAKNRRVPGSEAGAARAGSCCSASSLRSPLPSC